VWLGKFHDADMHLIEREGAVILARSVKELPGPVTRPEI
jgi:hypothetical protein